MAYIDIIGVDPGSQKTGWGIIRDDGGRVSLVACGLIRTSSGDGQDFSQRLATIYRELDATIRQYAPTEAAIEQVFAAKNVASALKLGQARGAAVAACAGNGLRIYDYEPTLIKRTLVGTGRAEKEQVAFMARRLLKMDESKRALDTTDALAAAICHAARRRFLLKTRDATGEAAARSL